jgi:hypothetical protein
MLDGEVSMQKTFCNSDFRAEIRQVFLVQSPCLLYVKSKLLFVKCHWCLILTSPFFVDSNFFRALAQFNPHDFVAASTWHCQVSFLGTAHHRYARVRGPKEGVLDEFGVKKLEIYP